MIQRALSGVILVVVMMSMIHFCQYSFALMLAIIAFGCLSEFFKMSTLAGAKPQKAVGYVMMSIIMAINILISLEILDILCLIFIIPTLLISFIAEMYRKEEHPLTNIASTLSGIIYCSLAPVCLLYLSVFSGDYFAWSIIGFMIMVWTNDVGAYLVGMSIGRHRLFERLSPKKSWEGFFGGVACTLLLGIYFAPYIGYSALFGAGLGAVISISGVLGDLIESMFKREVGIKDSGAIMPGHGGFLDRFDALLLSAPLTLIYFIIFT